MDPYLFQQWAFKLDTTKAGRIWDMTDALWNFLFCMVYMRRAFNIDSYRKALQAEPAFFYILDAAIAFLLLLLWLPRIIFARSWYKLCFSRFGIATLSSCLPVLFVAWYYRFALFPVMPFYQRAGLAVYFFPLRFSRLHFSIAKCLVPAQQGLINLSLIARKGISLLSLLMTTLLTVSAYIHLLYHLPNQDPKDPAIRKDMSYYDAFYALTVSCTFGLQTSIVPDGTAFRTLILYTMFAFTMYIPTRLSELLTLISGKSKFSRPFKPLPDRSFVVVCGHFDVSALQEFLREFFCSDHGSSTIRTQVVLLGWDEPNNALKTLLDDPSYHQRVQYVRGGATRFKDLVKINAKMAEACFVLSDKFSLHDPGHDDAESVMRSLAFKKFNQNVKLYVEVLLPENELHFDFLATETICVDKLKMGILSQSCLNVGFSTLIHLLITSVTEETCIDIIRQIEEKKVSEMLWVKEYVYGIGQELYPFPIPFSFKGVSFLKASEAIYDIFGGTLFAIGFDRRQTTLSTNQPSPFINDKTFDESLNRFDPKFTTLLLNPGEDYILCGDEIGIMICDQSQLPRDVFSYNWNWKKPCEGSSSPIDSICPVIYEESETTPLIHHMSFRKLLSKMEHEDIEEATCSQTISAKPQHHNQCQELGTSYRIAEILEKDIPITSQPFSHHKISTETFNPVDQQSKDFRSPSHDVNTNLVMDIVKVPETTVTAIKEEVLAEAHLLGDDEVPRHVGNHILLCCNSFPKNLEYFIIPLRQDPNCNSPPQSKITLGSGLKPGSSSQKKEVRNLSQPAIVVLCPMVKHEREWKRLVSRFSDLYYVKGSVINRKDLLRANVDKMKRAVVLTDTMFNTGDLDKTFEKERQSRYTIDANTLLGCLNLEMMCKGDKQVFIIGEFVHSENFKYVGKQDVVHPSQRFAKDIMRSSFMSGNVFSSSMLDTIMCQAYYNPFGVNLIKKLVFPYGSQLGSNSSSDLFSTSSKKTEGRIKKSAKLFQIDVPASLCNKTYQNLFSYFINYHFSIPIGLLRSAQEPDHPVSFVYINPFKKSLVREGDKIFLLSDKKPRFRN